MKYVFRNLLHSLKQDTFMILLALFTVVISSLVMFFSYGVYQNYQREANTKVTHVYQHTIKFRYKYKRMVPEKYHFKGDGTGWIHEIFYLSPPDDINETKKSSYANLLQSKPRRAGTGEFDLVPARTTKKTANVGQLKRFCKSMSDVICSNIDFVYAKAVVQKHVIPINISMEGGEFQRSKYIENALLSDPGFGLQSGRYFTDEEVMKGEHVGLVYDYRIPGPSSNKHPTLDKIMDKNFQEFTLQGKKFKVIGSFFDLIPRQTNYTIAEECVDSVTVPVTALDNDTKLVEDMTFCFKHPMSNPNFEELKVLCKKYFGDMVDMGKVDLMENPSLYLYHTIIFVMLFIALIAAVNFAMIYRFILLTRKRELCIYRLCGMSYLRCVIQYVTECMLLTMPAYLFSSFLYAGCLIKIVSKNFYYMKSSYDPKVYLLIFVIYFLTSLVSVIVMILCTQKRKVVFYR